MLAPKPSTVPMRVSVGMSGSGTPGLMRKRGLLDVGEVLGPGVERDVEHLGAELLAVLLLPGVDGRARGTSVRGDT